eukprot:gene14154-16279_t
MTYVNERISDEDIVKYRVEETSWPHGLYCHKNWVIDRERDIYLRNAYDDRGETTNEYWSFYWKGHEWPVYGYRVSYTPKTDSHIAQYTFGQGRIEERKDPSGVLDSKGFFSIGNNPFQFLIRITSSPKPPGYGSLTIGDYKRVLPFDHELIEKHLMPGVNGSDPLGPLKPMTNEARVIAGTRPLATHPKGYWVYANSNTTASYDASLIIDLDRNAQAIRDWADQFNPAAGQALIDAAARSPYLTSQFNQFVATGGEFAAPAANSA